jgi:1,2-diacylglycerol 3-beta-glucosyltransferase
VKDRIVLGALILLSWVVLFVLQKYTAIPSPIFILLGVMVFYSVLIQVAQYHQKRKKRKLIKKGLYDKIEAERKEYKPFVSILIPAHNEEFVIKDTIENILAINYNDYEVIVIDDRSTDGTAKVLENLSGQYNNLKCHIRAKDAFPGKSAVLNEVIPMTQGDVICVFDADARVNPDFLEKIIPYLSDPEVGAAQARKIIINEDLNFLTRCQNNEYALDTHFQLGRDCIKGAVELRGNGQLIKKEALKAIGGWNNYTITDDLDISTRLHLKGWDIRLCPDVAVYEEGVAEFFPLLRQRRRWVEGSIRRYLDYFLDLLTSRDISLRANIDMIAYIIEFILPVWLVSEYCIQGFKFIKGYDNHILVTLSIVPALSLFFFSGLLYSLKKYKKLSVINSAKQAIETGIYMFVVWVPVVSFIIFKIIFSKRTMDWGKTAHGTSEIPPKSTERPEEKEFALK